MSAAWKYIARPMQLATTPAPTKPTHLGRTEQGYDRHTVLPGRHSRPPTWACAAQHNTHTHCTRTEAISYSTFTPPASPFSCFSFTDAQIWPSSVVLQAKLQCTTQKVRSEILCVSTRHRHKASLINPATHPPTPLYTHPGCPAHTVYEEMLPHRQSCTRGFASIHSSTQHAKHP